ncbi:MAG TPA: hypothetical protein VF116_03065 [Ktedonobacterales bacterium]
MLRRLFALLAVALLLAGFGAVRATTPRAASYIAGGPNVVCGGTPLPC